MNEPQSGERPGMSILFRRAACAVLLTAAAGTAPAIAQRDARVLPGGNARAPIEVEGDNLEFVNAEKKAIYTGNVFAKQGDATLRSSRLTIFLTDNPAQPGLTAPVVAPNPRGGLPGGEVKRMEADGPVTLTSKDHIGRGDRAQYDKATNRVHLIGHVRLNKGVQTTRGGANSRLVYNLVTGHAQLTGGVHSTYLPGGRTAPARQGSTRGKPRS